MTWSEGMAEAYSAGVAAGSAGMPARIPAGMQFLGCFHQGYDHGVQTRANWPTCAYCDAPATARERRDAQGLAPLPKCQDHATADLRDEPECNCGNGWSCEACR